MHGTRPALVSLSHTLCQPSLLYLALSNTPFLSTSVPSVALARLSPFMASFLLLSCFPSSPSVSFYCLSFYCSYPAHRSVVVPTLSSLFLIRRSSDSPVAPPREPLTLRPIANTLPLPLYCQLASSTHSRQAHCQSFASSCRVCFVL